MDADVVGAAVGGAGGVGVLARTCHVSFGIALLPSMSPGACGIKVVVRSREVERDHARSREGGPAASRSSCARGAASRRGRCRCLRGAAGRDHARSSEAKARSREVDRDQARSREMVRDPSRWSEVERIQARWSEIARDHARWSEVERGGARAGEVSPGRMRPVAYEPKALTWARGHSSVTTDLTLEMAASCTWGRWRSGKGPVVGKRSEAEVGCTEVVRAG